MEFPLGDPAIGRNLPRHLNQPAGTEVRPRHLLLARPVALHRLSDGLRDARSFLRGFALVLTAIAAPGIRHDDVDVLLGDLEELREVDSNPERALRAGPHRELS